MFSEKHYQQLKWIIARNELANYRRQGSYEYQKPKSDSLIDLHERVSGLHLGLRAPQTDQMIDWLEGIDINLFKANKLDFEFDFQFSLMTFSDIFASFSPTYHLHSNIDNYFRNYYQGAAMDCQPDFRVVNSFYIEPSCYDFYLRHFSLHLKLKVGCEALFSTLYYMNISC